MGRLFKAALILAPLAMMIFFNNCGGNKVQFTAMAQSQNSSNGPDSGNSPSSVPTYVQLSPYVNAIAFEDLYYPPGTKCTDCPDYDYNDFMTEFQIVEQTNAQNNVTDIYVDFYPRAVGAGYDHSLLMVLTGTKTTASANSDILPTTAPMFNGSATVTLTYYDQNGNVIGTPTNPAYNQDIVIFPSTHGIFGNVNGGNIIDTVIPSGFLTGVPSNYIPAQQNARLHIVLDDPASNPAPASGQIDPSTFRVMLHVKPTNFDIDIINVDPKNFDANGYPWGFIIPTDWNWMKEGQKIDNGYPTFAQYRQSLMGQAAPGTNSTWYNYPVSDPNNTYLYPSIPFQNVLPAIP